VSVIRQLSLFGVEATPPEPGDLAGLLAGTGDISRLGGTARVTIVVDHPWRASVLVTECARRGLVATSVSTPDDHIEVRTAYSALLTPLAQAWTDGNGKRAPRGLLLDGRMLRLWVEAQGRRDGATAYVLPVGYADEPAREPIGAALAAIGLGAQLVSPRGGVGTSYRIVGKRRIERLVEMIGEPPNHAPNDIWPS
jgi:hypothetical protein